MSEKNKEVTTKQKTNISIKPSNKTTYHWIQWLLILLIICGTGWLLHLNQQQQLFINQLQSNQQQLSNQLNQHTHSVQEQLQQQQQSLQHLRKQNLLTQNHVFHRLLAITQLINSANLQNTLWHHQSTLIILQAAQKQLKTLNTPMSTIDTRPLQQQLATTISTISNQQNLSPSMVLTKLNNLLTLTEELPNPLITHTQSVNTKTTTTNHNQPSRWQAFLQTCKQLMSQLFIIKHTDTPLYFSSNQINYPATQLKLNLMTAQWAIMNQNYPLFQHSLQQSVSLIKTQFNKSLQQNQLLAQLSQLAVLNWQPMIIQNQRRLQKLQQQIKQLLSLHLSSIKVRQHITSNVAIEQARTQESSISKPLEKDNTQQLHATDTPPNQTMTQSIAA